VRLILPRLPAVPVPLTDQDFDAVVRVHCQEILRRYPSFIRAALQSQARFAGRL
jgi:hypothetical protein